MAKKKIQIEEAVQPVEVEKPQVVLAFRALGTFKDGNLSGHFAELGYGVEWKSGEIRHIPDWLYRLCVNSGGRFELA